MASGGGQELHRLVGTAVRRIRTQIAALNHQVGLYRPRTTNIATRKWVQLTSGR